ncbi:hypothetical protein GCM10027516_26460 [Niabella aquatica]
MRSLETLRITCTNNTGADLTDINITGCSDGHINYLQQAESKTLYMSIKADCSISVDYLWNGHRMQEEVIDYVTPGMGQKVHYKIEGK